MVNTIIQRAQRKDCDQIFALVNEAFELEIGDSGIAYRKCNKYTLKDHTRKHLEDMWVIRDGRKVSSLFLFFDLCILSKSLSFSHEAFLLKFLNEVSYFVANTMISSLLGFTMMRLR